MPFRVVNERLYDGKKRGNQGLKKKRRSAEEGIGVRMGQGCWQGQA